MLYHQDTGVPNAGAPVTISFSGDYNFRLTQGSGAYLHYDWSHQSAQRSAGQTSPENPNYTPLILNTGAYSLTDLRLGSRFLNSSLDVSLFVNNLTDSRPLINPGFSSLSYVWLASSLQPRTYGITAVWRH